jgi:hypothetical protein
MEFTKLFGARQNAKKKPVHVDLGEVNISPFTEESYNHLIKRWRNICIAEYAEKQSQMTPCFVHIAENQLHQPLLQMMINPYGNIVK